MHRFSPAIETVLHDAFATKGSGARLRNVLHNEGITTLGDLLALSEATLMLSPNIGRQTVDLLLATLATHGLALNGSISDETPAFRLSRIEQRITAIEEKILK